MPEAIIDNILYKQYTWDFGRILFHKDNVIITTWGRGKYEIIDSCRVIATWHNYEHILTFNQSFDTYTSKRLNDGVSHTGTLDNSLKDTIPLASEKNLLYFCVFHNKGYIELLDILLSSMLHFSKINNFDILVLTSNDFKPIIEGLSSKFNIQILIQTFEFNTQHEAGCARLSIFSYKYIDLYNKILYIDTDIIVQNDISRLFDIAIEDKIYAVQEYDINGEGHGAWFFDFTKFEKSTPAINSGVLLFQNTTKIRKLFANINLHINSLKKTMSIFPLCMDQPFIVYHSFINDACNNELMKQYVFLSEHNPPPSPSIKNDIIFCHFVWPIGDTEHKKHRMIQHFNNLMCESKVPG